MEIGLNGDIRLVVPCPVELAALAERRRLERGIVARLRVLGAPIHFIGQITRYLRVLSGQRPVVTYWNRDLVEREREIAVAALNIEFGASSANYSPTDWEGLD
eukprot:GHVU01234159.1.p2 GENE.GHVU01234159.1~~GHVU01234159.1.p2  ORF type:complete len:103 (+),score=10.24 GHVU01234159.1:409-717(+)